MRLNHKTALITGAGNGIGKESALLFAQEGAKVAVVDINEHHGEDTVHAIRKVGGEALFIKADIAKHNDVQHMIQQTEKHFGALHILFNNAGIMHPKDSDTESTEEAIWDLTMNINVKSVFLGCKFGIPALKRAGGGVIINTASFVALMGAATPQVAYSASKGAVVAMSRELAVLHAKENIRVVPLCPGPLHTELLMSFLNTEAKKQRRLVHVPMGRFGKASEIAKAALFIASDDASFITGNPFVVDGGITSAYVTAE